MRGSPAATWQGRGGRGTTPSPGASAGRGLLLALLLLMVPLAALAQCPPPLVPPDAAPPCPERYPSWAGELAVLGGNAFLGGLSAGVMHRLRGGEFGQGFLRGVAGGAVVYGGKRIATERFGGAGLVGRQVAAVGASMVRNAGEGRNPVERLTLPVGPFWLHVQAERPRVSARLDLVSAGWLVSGILNPDLRFDAGMSLSSGSHVFLADGLILGGHHDDDHAHGIAEPGWMAIGNVPAFGRHMAGEMFRHERVHVLQMDQLFLTVTGPLERRALEATPGLRRLAPWVEVNLSGVLLGVLGGAIDDYVRRPWEAEALFMSR